MVEITSFISTRGLVILHAAFGEIGALAFLWVLAELIDKQKKSYFRAKWVSLGGCIMFFTNWFLSGYYYVSRYKNFIKPAFKNTNFIWVSTIIMEVKENIFKFIPILALFAFIVIISFPNWSSDNKIPRKSIYAICILIVFLGFIMVSFGYIVSATIRANLGN